MVRPYVKQDFLEVKAWGEKWGSSYKEEYFPETGFIVPGVAAYFLYRTDSKICYLENMIRNPDASKELADKALEVIVTSLLRKANELGFEVAYATTASQSVIDRALRHNAEVTKGQSLITLRFKQ